MNIFALKKFIETVFHAELAMEMVFLITWCISLDERLMQKRLRDSEALFALK